MGSAADPGRVKVLACATVLEELRPMMPPTMGFQTFDFGLHLQPEGLRAALQEAVDDAARTHDVVLLGYGLCSMAVVGLEANGCTLVIPKADDCIGLFFTSRDAYQARTKQEPGTYYLTKGWIEVGDTILDEHDRMAAKYGPERADRMMSVMLRHYKRVVYIDTGFEDQDAYRTQAEAIARHFALGFEEMAGSTRWLARLLDGPWDEDFVVAPPGTTIEYADFRAKGESAVDLPAVRGER